MLQAALDKILGGLEQPQKNAPIVISGMASSSLGWQELPYGELPCPVDGSSLTWAELAPLASIAGSHRVRLISGLRTGSDVMRGEETQALGVFELLPDLSLNSLIVMPGTHSKHVTVDTGQITDFQTFMTGELFDVLTKHSILRHSVEWAAGNDTNLSGSALAAFLEGADLARRLPLSGALFRVRTRQVLDALPPRENRAFLSGALVGAELDHLSRGGDTTRPIVLCASAGHSAAYVAACEAFGLTRRLTVLPPEDVERLSALGQAVLLRHLGEI